MKFFNALVCLFLIICCNSVSYSQKITTGIYSGVNFSDIHGQDIGGKWSFKPGPVQGFNLGYSFNRTLGIQTGINFSTIYYEHKLSSAVSGQIYTAYYPGVTSYYPFIACYSPASGMMDFRFLRIPLLFTISIPSELQFRMRAGFFFSFLQDYSLYNYNYYSSIGPEKPEKHDFGYVFSSGISYPFNDNFKATFDIGYLTGRKEFLKNNKYRHGSSEFSLGIAYSGFLKNKNTGIPSKSESDSSSKKVTVTFRGGLNYSWNKASKEKYSGYFGPAIGFSLKFPFGKGASFQTGFSFERKGYSIKDSSASFYRIIKNNNQIYYVDTKVQTDYGIIPALLSFPVGKSERFHISTGPWLGLKLNARSVGVAYDEYHSGDSYQLRKTVVYDDLEKAIQDYDLGWIIGCGVSIPVVKNYRVEMALQYSTGFRDVFDNSGTGDMLNPSDPGLIIKNRTISLLLGFRLPSAYR